MKRSTPPSRPPTRTGILGFPISFTDEGDLNGGGIYIVQVKGDAFVPVTAVTLEPPFGTAE